MVEGLGAKSRGQIVRGREVRGEESEVRASEVEKPGGQGSRGRLRGQG